MYFVDTNVPIGFTVIHDKWHEPSKRFIEDNEGSIFWSNLVKEEYDEKLEEIIDVSDEFLKSVILILKNNEKDFISYDEFEKFILKRTKFSELDTLKKQKILSQFWEKNNFIEGISTVVHSRFLKFAFDFETQYDKRDIELKNILMLHDCGLDNYLKYYNYALRLYKNGVHPPDCKIIMDAHDCGLSHDDLIFISNDADMIESINNQNTSYLNIIEFKSCN